MVLVETLPTGTEKSPVEKNLIRNLLQTNWDGRKQLLKNRAKPVLRNPLDKYRRCRQLEPAACHRLGGRRKKPGGGGSPITLHRALKPCGSALRRAGKGTARTGSHRHKQKR